ncbi:hypothetical protein BDV06DRAFT_222452 [Aspergillus oleicola]
MIPRVVVQVGFSESYQDLKGDMQQWLRRPRPPPKIVIFIKFEEDKRSLKKYQDSEGFRRKRHHLLLYYGKELALGQQHDNVELHGQEQDREQARDPTSTEFLHLIDNLKSEIIASDWVGPLNAFLKVWEMNENENEPTMRERTDILPCPAQPQNPTIRATDLIPEKYRAHLEDFDNFRMAHIDMNDYSKLLKGATRRLPFARALKILRRSTSKDNDPSYVTN